MAEGSAPARPESAGAFGMLGRWQEEVSRNILRMQNFATLILHREQPEVGLTPREEIYRKHKSSLYRYPSSRIHPTPLLFVPDLGISRPYIFDLVPGGSFVEHMVRQW
jgi:poly(3-hydroxyalkanoate) synthetase